MHKHFSTRNTHVFTFIFRSIFNAPFYFLWKVCREAAPGGLPFDGGLSLRNVLSRVDGAVSGGQGELMITKGKKKTEEEKDEEEEEKEEEEERKRREEEE